MTRHRMHAVRAILVFLALCGVSPALLTRSAHAATVFSNVTEVKNLALVSPFLASGFTPAGDYDFTGGAAFVYTSGSNPFSMALYSSTSGGAPDARLWTSGTLTASNGSTLVGDSYSGSPILLQKGVEYFLVLDLPSSGAVGWVGGGSSSTPLYTSFDGTSWTNGGNQNLQFEVSGSPVAAIPEPSTWAMLLLGFAGLGFLGWRSQRRAGAAAP
jgi:hypothetical protein